MVRRRNPEDLIRREQSKVVARWNELVTRMSPSASVVMDNVTYQVVSWYLVRGRQASVPDNAVRVVLNSTFKGQCCLDIPEFHHSDKTIAWWPIGVASQDEIASPTMYITGLPGGKPLTFFRDGGSYRQYNYQTPAGQTGACARLVYAGEPQDELLYAGPTFHFAIESFDGVTWMKNHGRTISIENIAVR